MINRKLIRITTIPGSLRGLLKGQLKYMSENGYHVIAVSSSGEALEDVRKNEQVEVSAVEMTRSITPVKDAIALIKLIILLKREKPQIVHTHTPKAGLLGMIAAKISGVPIRLHTVAGLPLTVATGNKRKLLSAMERITYACATKVFPNSIGLQKIILSEKFTSPQKLKVIGNGSSNGIDTSQFDPSLISTESKQNLRTELQISKDDFVFLYIGRVVSDKGVNELIEAFDNLSKDSKDVHLVIVGSYEKNLDPLNKNTEDIIDSHPNIHAVGFKTNVIDYFAMADVLAFPSYREGFPNVVMQAASMQMNCIVTNINGCNEIITNGENGWVIPVKDSVSLLDRMKWCNENRQESRKMGHESRKLMQEKYERLFVWQEMLKEYKSITK